MSLIHEFVRPATATRTLPANGRFADSFQDLHELNGGPTSASCDISAAEYNAAPILYQLGTRWFVKDTVTGDYIWGGEINDPQQNEDGTYSITADGYGKLSDKRSRPFLVLSYNLEQWLTGDTDPLSYPMSEKYDVNIKGDKVAFRIPKQTSFKRNKDGNPDRWEAGVYRWTPQAEIRYIAFHLDVSHPMPSYHLQVVRANGPSGAVTVVNSWDLASPPAEITENIVAGQDLVGIRIWRNDEDDKPPMRLVTISNLRIGGLTQDDTFTIEQAFGQLFSLMGCVTTDIEPSTNNIAPFEADSGTLGQIADEIALFSNWYWRVVAHPDTGLPHGEAGPMGTVSWELSRETSPVIMFPQPRFTHVVYSYKSKSGIVLTRSVEASPDPIDSDYSRDYILDWEEPPSLAVAELFASRVADYLVEARATGRTSFTYVTNPLTSLEEHGTVVRPGDKLILTNNDNVEVIASRIDHDADAAVTHVDMAEGMPTLDRWLERRQRLLNKGINPNKATFLVLGTDIPETPENVQVEYGIREIDNELRYRATVTWDPVTDDIQGDGTLVKVYHVQMRPVNAAGEWLHEDGSVAISGRGYTLRDHVERKLSTDDPDDVDTKSTFGPLLHPRHWYWQARVRAEDLIGQLSDWSAWTTQTLPFTDAEPNPPAPDGLVMTFDAEERDKWTRISADLQFNEVTDFSYPGDPGGPHDDVSRYEIQLQNSRDAVTPIKTRSFGKEAKDADADTVTHKRVDRVRKHYYYRFRVRSVDRWNRRGVWSDWNNWATPTDTTAPPPPLNVGAYPDKNVVICDWDDPPSTIDPNEQNEDVAFYRIVCATRRDFTTDSIVKIWRVNPDTRVKLETEKYKQNYYFRVWSVDSSFNRSAYTQVGPVRPSKTRVTRQPPVGNASFPTEVDHNDIYDLLSIQRNSAYVAAPLSAPSIAYCECDSDVGTLELQMTTGSVNNRIYAGALLRYQDDNNYLWVALVDQAVEGEGIFFGKMQGGTLTTLASNLQDIDKENTYHLRIEMGLANANEFLIYLNDNLIMTESSSLFAGETNHGMFMKSTGNTGDNLQMRFEHIKFTCLDPLLGITLDDEFDRQAGNVEEPPPTGGGGSETFGSVLGEMVPANEMLGSGV